MGRTLAFGDIHGCITALETLLDNVQPVDDDKLVFLGDYVDRGPDSFAVLERVMALHAGAGAVCLRGNHELMMLDARAGGNDLRFWLGVGGAEALESYAARFGDEGVPPGHYRFLEEACVSFHEDDRHLFVHATAYPDLPLADQPDELLFWRRFGDPEPHVSGKRLVTGHTSQKSGCPRNIGHAVCIDTYCYGGQWLTCLDCTGDVVHQANEAGHYQRWPLAHFLIDPGA